MKEPGLLDAVALLVDRPEAALLRGQVGTIVEILDGDHFEVEFSDEMGQGYAMLALPRKELLLLRHKPEHQAA